MNVAQFGVPQLIMGLVRFSLVWDLKGVFFVSRFLFSRVGICGLAGSA